MTLDNYQDFIRYFRERSGLDLNSYKPEQMQRRIEQFIRIRGYQNYLSFQDRLKADPELLASFTRHLTINVSEFLRDTGQWEVLIRKILPNLIRHHTGFRVWSAGCSGGQEAYTLAMVLQEYFPATIYSILATDIDEAMLTAANTGIYKTGDLKNLSEELKNRYFNPVAEGYQVKERLKLNLRFENLNLLTGHFETDFDLICCRNVVIYFTENAKNILFRRFIRSLKPEGVLFLGSTEQIFNLDDLGLETTHPFFYHQAK